MIAVASSTPVALSRATEVANTDWLDQALALQQAVLPPVVFTEALRTPELDCETADLLQDLPVLDIRSGFRERAAETRARILAKRSRARLADGLIAQRAPIIARRWSRATATSGASRRTPGWIRCSRRHGAPLCLDQTSLSMNGRLCMSRTASL